MSVNPTARLTSRDRDLLLAVQDHALAGFAPLDIVDRIERKLAAAVVLTERLCLADCVQIGSDVAFRIGREDERLATLVLNGRQAYPDPVTIASPLGLALLGMPAGVTVSVEGQAPALRIDAVTPPVQPAPAMATSVSEFLLG